MRRSTAELRRVRPWLGTFVEIRVRGPRGRTAAAVDAAFREIERIHRLMSPFDDNSDVSRLRREAALHPVRVHRDTLFVLRRAVHLSQLSGGVFDVSVGATLRAWERPAAGRVTDVVGNYRAIRFLPRGHVCFERPLAVDLGGIAKGFAVDRAIQSLRQRGVCAALVNAGGDLRAYGGGWPVFVRAPRRGGEVRPLLVLDEGAVASSSAALSRRRHAGKPTSALVHGVDRHPYLRSRGLTVIARRCIDADALTKVLAFHSAPGPVLRRFGATGFTIDARGRAAPIS